MYGIVITEKGLELDAKLRAGDQLKLTRVMVGDGTVPEDTNPRKLTDLISPFAEATSTAPVAVGASTMLVIEYRNDMNGGLEQDRYINEYGLWAQDPDGEEILYLYGNLGDFREPVRTFKPNEPVITRRYPISITVSDGVDVALGYQPSVFMTEAKARAIIAAHNEDGNAHHALLQSINDSVQKLSDYVHISDETADLLGGAETVDDALGALAQKATALSDTSSNLLDNWYFVGGGSQQGGGQFPINQRGETEYSGPGYGIDRWICQDSTGKVEISGSGVKFTNGYFRQFYEHSDLLLGRMVTFSILTDNNELVSVTEKIPTEISKTGILSNWSERISGLSICIYCYSITAHNRMVTPVLNADQNGGTVVAAKLELGSVQTLARQENGQWALNEIPNYAEQYVICSQYSPLNGAFIGSQHSNSNLLDNWYFVDPINQRGETEYTVDGYAIDRWIQARLNTKVTGDGLSIVTRETEATGSFNQLIEKKNLVGKTVTMSVLINGELYTATDVFSSNHTTVKYYYFYIGNIISYFSLYYSNREKDIVRFGIGMGEKYNCVVQAVKLELGPVQTLAHKEGDTWVLNEIPNHAEQFAICAQYDPTTGEFVGPFTAKSVQVPDALSQKYGLSGVNWPNDLFSILSESTLYKNIPKYTPVKLSEIPEGSIIQILEGDTAVDFYVAKHNYESGLNGTGRTLVVRKGLHSNRVWRLANVNAYAVSDIDAWLNSDYKNLLSERVRAAIGTTKFYYTPGNGDKTVTTLGHSVFLLSATELGQTTTYANTEGTALSSTVLNLLKIDGMVQWTRSPYTGNTSSVFFLDSNTLLSNPCTSAYGAHPAFTLPSDLTLYRDNDGIVHEEQVYDKYISDILGNRLINIPSAQIQIGSYIGTGTSGQSSPCSITFDFVPKMVKVMDANTTHEMILWISDKDNIKISGNKAQGLIGYLVTPALRGTSISWYSTDEYLGAASQGNTQGESYCYMAFG